MLNVQAEYGSTAEAEAADNLGRFWKTFQQNPVQFAVLLMLVLYGGWFFSTHGWENRRITYSTFVADRSGYSIGSHTLFALKGQTITIDYDIESMPRGELRIMVMRPNHLFTEDAYLYRSTRGHTDSDTIQLEVPQTGLYKVDFDGFPDGNGYDITFKASWRVG